ncbi:MAG: hypothetical protein RIG62_17960 [Cyclobacteriaceae bacterium]
MNKKLPKELVQQVQTIAKDLADYEHLRYLSDPEKLSWKKETSRVLTLSSNNLENSYQVIGKLVGSKKTPAEVQKELIQQVLNATQHIVKDMKQTASALQREQMKALPRDDPKYQQKKLLVQNGILEMPENRRYDLYNSINAVVARTEASRQLLKRNDADTVKQLTGKEHLIDLSKELQKQSQQQRLQRGGDQSSINTYLNNEKKLAIIEYRIRFNIADKKDYKELMVRARGQLQSNKDKMTRSKPNDPGDAERENQRIIQSVDGIRRAVYREQVIKESAKLGKSVHEYEKSVQRDVLKQPITLKQHWKGLQQALQLPNKDPKSAITEISHIIKGYNRDRIYVPHKNEIKNNNFPGTPNQQQYQHEQQHSYRLQVNAHLERFEKNYKIDQKLPNPDGRATERNHLKYRITVLAKKYQKEMSGDFLRPNAKNIQALEKHIDAMGVNKNLKIVSENIAKTRAQKLEFNQRSRKQRPRM